MSSRATSVNPRLLVWARERAGISIQQAAERVGKSAEILEAWERGEQHPTYSQLETLAEAVYRRPVALFFLPEPPEEAPVQRQFRTLPEAEVENLAPDTRYALRDARAYQESLRDLTGGHNPAERVITRDLRATRRTDPQELAQRARIYLGVRVEDQRSWASTRVAMTEWRNLVESAGVFVFKRSFRQREVSGFCVDDAEFPIIVVNNSTPFTRQIFTLFHELAHLLYGVSSITKDDPNFLARFASGENRNIEVSCNRFAAELLVPDDSLPWNEFQADGIDEFLSAMASRYHVSREVILRRLLDRGFVESETYGSRVATWAREAQESDARSSGESGGGNYYATQASYLGRNYLALAFGQFRAGRITIAELAEHLGMKARNVSKLEDFLVGSRA